MTYLFQVIVVSVLASGHAGQVFPKNAKYPMYMDKFKTNSECEKTKDYLTKALGIELICVEMKKI